jgi:hypothetical protein
LLFIIFFFPTRMKFTCVKKLCSCVHCYILHASLKKIMMKWISEQNGNELKSVVYTRVTFIWNEPKEILWPVLMTTVFTCQN